MHVQTCARNAKTWGHAKSMVGDLLELPTRLGPWVSVTSRPQVGDLRRWCSRWRFRRYLFRQPTSPHPFRRHRRAAGIWHGPVRISTPGWKQILLRALASAESRHAGAKQKYATVHRRAAEYKRYPLLAPSSRTSIRPRQAPASNSLPKRLFWLPGLHQVLRLGQLCWRHFFRNCS